MKIIAQLREKFDCDSAIAAALAMSRQAFSQAAQRGRLSNRAALVAAQILGIDAGAALLANMADASNDAAPPVINTAPTLTDQTPETRANNTNYARLNGIKKTGNPAVIHWHVHKITSQEQEEAIDLIRWVFAVARLPADSPRFNWYVSRWSVPDKIAAAKKAGTFDALTAECPPIDPAWIRYVPDALKAAADFKNANSIPKRDTRAACAKSSIEINRKKKAA